MATKTTNYGLTKPAEADFYNIGVFNGNADIVDAALADIAVKDSFIYKCTGTGDSTAIAALVNAFFNNGTAMTMKLIITGTMGIAFTNTYYAMYINATNTRGAVCELDFSDCNIPEITTTNRDLLYVLSTTARLNITGLRVTTTRYSVSLAGSNNSFSNCIITSSSGSGVSLTGSNNSFSNCTITGSSGSGVYLTGSNNSFSNCIITGSNDGVNSTGNNNSFRNCTITGSSGYGAYLYGLLGIATFVACKIVGASNGVCTPSGNTATIIRLIGCSIKGSGSAYDVYQTSGASTISWFIMGCAFTYSSIYVNGAAMSVSSSNANAYLYMPAYANYFNVAIE